MLDFFGLFEVNTTYVVLGLLVCIIALFVLLILNLNKQKQLKDRLDHFLKGKDAKEMETLITTRFDEVDFLKDEDKQKNKHLKSLDESMTLAYSKTGIVKYDAFNEMGGKLSFALCVLDNRNNGYIINAMHSREGCYTYIKEVIGGESFITLGEEEERALKKAINNENGEE